MAPTPHCSWRRFGGITSVRVLIDDQTGKCNGALCREARYPSGRRLARAGHSRPPAAAAVIRCYLQCSAAMPAPSGGPSAVVCTVARSAELPSSQHPRAALRPLINRLAPIPHPTPLLFPFPSHKAGIGFVNYTSAEAARAAQEAMNGVSMGDRLLHVMVQNPAGRPGRTPSSTPIGAPSVGMAQLAGVQGLQTSRPQLPPSVFQAANNLGLNASTLASLQAGLIPASAGMQLQTGGMPLAVGGQTYNGTMAGQPTSFGSLQW